LYRWYPQGQEAKLRRGKGEYLHRVSEGGKARGLRPYLKPRESTGNLAFELGKSKESLAEDHLARVKVEIDRAKDPPSVFYSKELTISNPPLLTPWPA